MVAWANEDWQARILYRDIDEAHEILKIVWIEQTLGRQWRSRNYRLHLTFLVEGYDGSHAQTVRWCWGRISSAERMLRSGGRHVPQRSLIWIERPAMKGKI